MRTFNVLKNEFKYWEITKDLIDQSIDIMLNLSQSGHPGGSRSKVHAMVATLLSGAMRWDIRGTSPINSLIQILPKLKKSGPNIKIVAAISMDLFKMQTREYQQSIISTYDWNDSMIITNTSIKLMGKWIVNRFVSAYSMAPDYDNRWRSGGTLDQIIIESKLDPSSIWVGINRFSNERSKRLESLKKEIPNF